MTTVTLLFPFSSMYYPGHSGPKQPSSVVIHLERQTKFHIHATRLVTTPNDP